MKKITLLFLILPFLGLAQVQIGDDIYGENSNARLGRSVSLSTDGNILAIGAGALYNDDDNIKVYENNNGNWMQIGNTIFAEDNLLGASISLSSDGSVLAAGLPWDELGEVRIYKYLDNSWTQIGSTIYGEYYNDKFGKSISLSSDGSTIAIGAPDAEIGPPFIGYTNVYKNINDVWTKIGDDIIGQYIFEHSGTSVSLSNDGNILAIGAPHSSSYGSDYPRVRIFQNINNDWIQIGSDILGEEGGIRFGEMLSLNSDGNVIAIGEPYNCCGTSSLYVYENINNQWVQLGNTITNGQASSQFGSSIALNDSGNIIAVGALGYNNNTGQIRVYRLFNNNWIKLIEIDSEYTNDYAWNDSISISADGSILAIGYERKDANGFEDSGIVQVFDVSEALSVEENRITNFTLYPNPTKTQFTIQLDPSVKLEKVSIYNTLSQVVLTSEEYIINTSKLSSGSYIVEITTNKGKATKKLIVE